MAEKKDAKPKKKSVKYRCNFCGHKEIIVGDVVVGNGFELAPEHEKDKKFMQAFNRALELKTICLC